MPVLKNHSDREVYIPAILAKLSPDETIEVSQDQAEEFEGHTLIGIDGAAPSPIQPKSDAPADGPTNTGEVINV